MCTLEQTFLPGILRTDIAYAAPDWFAWVRAFVWLKNNSWTASTPQIVAEPSVVVSKFASFGYRAASELRKPKRH